MSTYVYADSELVPHFQSISRAGEMIISTYPALIEEIRYLSNEMEFETWQHPSLTYFDDPYTEFIKHLVNLVIIGDHGLLVRTHRELYPYISPQESYGHYTKWREELLLHGTYDQWAAQIVDNDLLFTFVLDKGRVLASIQIVVWHIVTILSQHGFALVI